MGYQWSDTPAPEIEYDINEGGELLIFNLAVGKEKFVDLKLAKLQPGDRDFFEGLDNNASLTTHQSCKKQVERFCSEWNAKPFTGLSGDTETLEALTSVLLLCRPKAYLPTKAKLVEVPPDLKIREWKWSDEPAPRIYYQLNADYSISLWNVPDGSGFVEVKLRPLSENDRTWFNQITTGIGTPDEQSAKLISGLCVGWGTEKGVKEEVLLLNPDAVGAIDRVMAVCFPRSFRPVKRRSRGVSGDSLQAQ